MFRAFFRGRCATSAVVQISWVWCQCPGADTIPYLSPVKTLGPFLFLGMTLIFQIIFKYSLWTTQRGHCPSIVWMQRLTYGSIMSNGYVMDWITEQSRLLQGTIKIFCSLSRSAKPAL
jgi:hypothetical protein